LEKLVKSKREECVKMKKIEYFSKKKSKVYIAISAFLIFFLIFSIVYFLWSLMQYNEAMEKKQEKEAYIIELKNDIQRLEYMLDAPLDDEFKIRVAREKLGMCFPDEIIFYSDYD
jgi:cbb3-type cytochrome oxidase subunit 3